MSKWLKTDIIELLKLSKFYEWFFGPMLMTTVGVIAALIYFDNFGKWVLIGGLLMYYVATLINKFDENGWFEKYKSKKR
ncbi:hypothetical protein ACFLWV_03790 [Chloroflexota bacterium]